MLAYVWPAVFAMFVWWFSTGIVLYVVGRDARTHTHAMWVVTVLAACALGALWWFRDETSTAGAYIAFAAALTVWGWHEMSFLTGKLTGPRTTACPGRPDHPTEQRAPLIPAVQSVIYHEIAIALTAALIAVLTLGGGNLVGLWTFVILWLMRLSAKLNIYFGVRNLTEQFLPDNLQYLKTYFCRRPMNAFFPFTVTVSTVVTTILAAAALHASATPFEVTGLTFLTILMALAVLEHWFLVMPFPAERLWTWGLASRAQPTPESVSEATAAKAAKTVGMATA